MVQHVGKRQNWLLGGRWLLRVSYSAGMIVLPAAYIAATGVLIAGMCGTGVTHAQPKRIATLQGTQAVTTGTQLELDRQVAKLDEDRKELERLQDYLKQRTDELEHLITNLTLGSGIYTVLLGLLAWFGLKQAKDDADRMLKRFSEENKERSQEFKDLVLKMEDEVPSLMKMQERLEAVLRDLQRQVNVSQIWTGKNGVDSYQEMTEDERQRVLLAEMTVASLDFFRFQSDKRNGPTVARILMELARFYTAKATVKQGLPDPADMRRAWIYIEHASNLDSENAQLLVQKGAFILLDTQGKEETKQNGLNEAEDKLRGGLRIDPKSPAGLYNLAWVLDERKKYKEAVQCLTELVVQKDKFPSTEPRSLLILGYMNRACARAKDLGTLGVEEAKKSQLAIVQIVKDCVDAQHEADSQGKVASDRCKDGLRREWSEGGDIWNIRAHLSGDLRSTVEGLLR